MSREKSPHQCGEFWLGKRPDGKSKNWQVCWYDRKAKTQRYVSTFTTYLDVAKSSLDLHYEKAKSKCRQGDNAIVLPHLLLYWTEHAEHVTEPAQIASSIRQFVGFLQQDELGDAASFDQLTPEVWLRFQRWRMKPHSYSVPWGAKTISHRSKGVCGETVQRNLDDIGAAIQHAAKNRRIPPQHGIPPVASHLRSGPRERDLSVAEVGSMIGFAESDPVLHRYILAMLGTACRPEAVLKWKPWLQIDADGVGFNCHPPGAPRTKKVNAWVAIPDGYRPFLEAWADSKEHHSGSIRTRWNTMRRALGLGQDVKGNTMRHFVATQLINRGVSEGEVAWQLGHRSNLRITRGYAKRRPKHDSEVRKVMDEIWSDVMASVRTWKAQNRRVKAGNGNTAVVRIVGS